MSEKGAGPVCARLFESENGQLRCFRLWSVLIAYDKLCGVAVGSTTGLKLLMRMV